MTKKQIERLKNWFCVQVRMNQDNPEKITAAIKYLDDLLNAMFFTYFIEDYQEIGKIRKEIIGAGMEEYKKIQEEKIA